jgi:hypothetical protein
MEHARVAGRLVAQEALLLQAQGGEGHARTLAATQLLVRAELIKGLGKAIERKRRKFLAMSDAERSTEADRVAAKLRGDAG